jgi:hypothetical protein
LLKFQEYDAEIKMFATGLEMLMELDLSDHEAENNQGENSACTENRAALRGLSFLLRHSEQWPKGFVWINS